MTVQPSEPAVQAFVQAINSGDRAAFDALLDAGATMSDDGTDRDLRSWADGEIFNADGRMDVESESDGGLALIAEFTNSTWGSMRTRWRFTVADGKITRFETGQA
ncbi:nuclear transport factor 2 family protein [Sciscionella marina]|uniref:nuclear transport factor 2 family protein n=1 Tax=Sciscionella marina TaxID=508770 RepID=UPI000377380E|nr:nuclear transport factor 2 family protein [Sciscionella marina]